MLLGSFGIRSYCNAGRANGALHLLLMSNFNECQSPARLGSGHYRTVPRDIHAATPASIRVQKSLKQECLVSSITIATGDPIPQGQGSCPLKHAHKMQKGLFKKKKTALKRLQRQSHYENRSCCLHINQAAFSMGRKQLKEEQLEKLALPTKAAAALNAASPVIFMSSPKIPRCGSSRT
jgi:hypothetical protein